MSVHIRLIDIVFATACAASLGACGARSASDTPEKGGRMTERHIIRAIRLAHCKRGPQRCDKCKEMDVERICLLDIAPDDYGMLQRRMIEVVWEGERTLREFDVVRTFESVEDARRYARENGIADVKYESE